HSVTGFLELRGCSASRRNPSPEAHRETPVEAHVVVAADARTHRRLLRPRLYNRPANPTCGAADDRGWLARRAHPLLLATTHRLVASCGNGSVRRGCARGPRCRSV